MKFRYNHSFNLSRFSFHHGGKFYDFNGLICLNFDGIVLNIGFKAKNEEWFTSHKSFPFHEMSCIQFREFDQKIHEEFVCKDYKPCGCGKDVESTWISGYSGYILCGNCNGKITF